MFLVLGTIRFFEIRPIGFASRVTVYSRFFIAKMAISYFLCLLYLSLTILGLTLDTIDSGRNTTIWFINYGVRPVCLIYIVFAGAWLYSARLMRYEYRKRLSEGNNLFIMNINLAPYAH